MVSLRSIDNLKQGGQLKNWINTPTKAIRIPIIFEEKILSYARQLDEGLPIGENQDYRNVQEILSDILIKIKEKKRGYQINSASQLIKDIKQLINEVN